MLRKYILNLYSKIFFNQLDNHVKLMFRKLETYSRKLITLELHLQFNIIFIYIDFVRQAHGFDYELYWFLQISRFIFNKTEKIARTLPTIKSNSISFLSIKLFLKVNNKNITKMKQWILIRTDIIAILLTPGVCSVFRVALVPLLASALFTVFFLTPRKINFSLLNKHLLTQFST